MTAKAKALSQTLMDIKMLLTITFAVLAIGMLLFFSYAYLSAGFQGKGLRCSDTALQRLCGEMHQLQKEGLWFSILDSQSSEFMRIEVIKDQENPVCRITFPAESLLRKFGESIIFELEADLIFINVKEVIDSNLKKDQLKLLFPLKRR